MSFVPRLNILHLRVHVCDRRVAELDNDTERFLYFAFSEIRARTLYFEVKERFCATHCRLDDGETRKFNGQTRVYIDYLLHVLPDESDDTMDYETSSHVFH